MQRFYLGEKDYFKRVTLDINKNDKLVALYI